MSKDIYLEDLLHALKARLLLGCENGTWFATIQNSRNLGKSADSGMGEDPTTAIVRMCAAMSYASFSFDTYGKHYPNPPEGCVVLARNPWEIHIKFSGFITLRPVNKNKKGA